MVGRLVERYSSAVVLGINDALIGLTGTIVGLTLAVDDVKLIGLSALIMGIASSLSMAASSYLSHKELNFTEADKAGIATGISYFLQAVVISLPYFLLEDKWEALAGSLALALASVALYNAVVAKERGEAFLPRFLRMLAVSGGVALFLYAFTRAAAGALGVMG